MFVYTDSHPRLWGFGQGTSTSGQTQAQVAEQIVQTTSDRTISRDNTVTNVAPTSVEYPTPPNPSTALVVLDDGKVEVWEYNGTWSLGTTLEPGEDREIVVSATPLVGAAPAGAKLGVDTSSDTIFKVEAGNWVAMSLGSSVEWVNTDGTTNYPANSYVSIDNGETARFDLDAGTWAWFRVLDTVSAGSVTLNNINGDILDPEGNILPSFPGDAGVYILVSEGNDVRLYSQGTLTLGSADTPRTAEEIATEIAASSAATASVADAVRPELVKPVEAASLPEAGDTVADGAYFFRDGITYRNDTGADWVIPANWPNTAVSGVYPLPIVETYETVADLMASTSTRKGVGNFWRAGNYLYVEDTAANRTINTAGSVNLRYVFNDIYYLNARGNLTGSQLRQALEDSPSTVPVAVEGIFSDALNAVESEAFLDNINRVWFLTPGSEIVLEGQDFNRGANFMDLDHPYLLNCIIGGRSFSKRDITATQIINSVGPFDHEVELTIQDPPGQMAVGAYLTITVTTGPHLHQCYQGVCEILAYNPATPDKVTVRVPYKDAVLPVQTSITGRYRLLTTVLTWTEGRGIAFSNSTGMFRNMVVRGYYDPRVDSPSDGPNDGILVGQQANTHVTGNTETTQVNDCWVQLEAVAIIGWPNNGVQGKGGKCRGIDLVISNCGWRSFQIGNGGEGNVKGMVCTGGGASLLETEGGAGCVASDATLVGGLAQGAATLGSASLQISDSEILLNGTHGVDISMADVLANGVVITDNQFSGILCDRGGRFTGDNAESTGNNLIGNNNQGDVVASGGGTVNISGGTVGEIKLRSIGKMIARGATFTGDLQADTLSNADITNANGNPTITVDTGARVIDPSGTLIQ